MEISVFGHEPNAITAQRVGRLIDWMAGESLHATRVQSEDEGLQRLNVVLQPGALPTVLADRGLGDRIRTCS